jgi:hypothetical protein
VLAQQRGFSGNGGILRRLGKPLLGNTLLESRQVDAARTAQLLGCALRDLDLKPSEIGQPPLRVGAVLHGSQMRLLRLIQGLQGGGTGGQALGDALAKLKLCRRLRRLRCGRHIRWTYHGLDSRAAADRLLSSRRA